MNQLKTLISIALVLSGTAAIACNNDKQKAIEEQKAELKFAKERRKAEKRAAKAIDWSFEHRDRPMPVANIKGDCE